MGSMLDDILEVSRTYYRNRELLINIMTIKYGVTTGDNFSKTYKFNSLRNEMVVARR